MWLHECISTLLERGSKAELPAPEFIGLDEDRMNMGSLQIPVLDRAPYDRGSDPPSRRRAPMSFDLALVDQVYRHDPARTASLFEHHDEPLLVIVVNDCQRVIYANEVARWAFAPDGDLSPSDVHLEVVAGSFLGDAAEQAIASGGPRAFALRTLPTALAEEWMAAAAPTSFDGKPAVCIIVGRRSLRRVDVADRTAQTASHAQLTECLLRQVGLVWVHLPGLSESSAEADLTDPVLNPAGPSAARQRAQVLLPGCGVATSAQLSRRTGSGPWCVRL
jgi:hypothetical protein